MTMRNLTLQTICLLAASSAWATDPVSRVQGVQAYASGKSGSGAGMVLLVLAVIAAALFGVAAMKTLGQKPARSGRRLR
ncbi:MAG: hypothetical protein H6704_13835 [Myxococcales bacterium]|nr:hypothetical protein [Myxococcales bacterium]MCB9537328.1 hypothetical protein [Myxococcales bacterium]